MYIYTPYSGYSTASTIAIDDIIPSTAVVFCCIVLYLLCYTQYACTYILHEHKFSNYRVFEGVRMSLGHGWF